MGIRTIIFRGKRIDNGEWVEGYYYKAKFYRDDTELCGYITIPHPSENGRGNEHFMVLPETVGQYTGLTDKNGKKIFEGDIIAGAVHWLERMKNGVVAFRCGSFGLIWHRGDVEQFNPFTSMCNVEYEVIGTIHDNPGLIGGGDNA